MNIGFVGIDRTISMLQNMQETLDHNLALFLQKLGDLGFEVANATFAEAKGWHTLPVEQYDVSCSLDVTNNKAVITAYGRDVLFIEFGAGIKWSARYSPDAYKFGMGVGTYPSEKGNWDNPKGWWYTGDDGKSHHSAGYPAANAMYNAKKEIEQNIETAFKEVFFKK